MARTFILGCHMADGAIMAVKVPTWAVLNPDTPVNSPGSWRNGPGDKTLGQVGRMTRVTPIPETNSVLWSTFQDCWGDKSAECFHFSGYDIIQPRQHALWGVLVTIMMSSVWRRGAKSINSASATHGPGRLAGPSSLSPL